MVDAELVQLKEFFNQRLSALEKSVEEAIRHLSEKIDVALSPVARDVERLRSSIDELYAMDRKQAAESAEIRSEIARLDQAQKEKARLTNAMVGILSVIVAAITLWFGFRK